MTTCKNCKFWARETAFAAWTNKTSRACLNERLLAEPMCERGEGWGNIATEADFGCNQFVQKQILEPVDPKEDQNDGDPIRSACEMPKP